MTTDASATLLAHIPIPPKLLVSLIVLGLALIIWAIVAAVNRGNKSAQVPQGAPACPTCRGPARWAYTHWVCDRCRTALPPPGQYGMPPGPMQPPGPYGQMAPGQYGQPPGQMGAPGQMPPNMAPPGMPPQMQAPNAPAPAPDMAGAAPQQIYCQTCRNPGRWIPESNGWGCDHCRQMIQPALPPPA